MSENTLAGHAVAVTNFLAVSERSEQPVFYAGVSEQPGGIGGVGTGRLKAEG